MVDTSRNFYNSYGTSGNQSYLTPRMDATTSSSYGNPSNNRSMHGNYLDNSLTYDPYKEKRSLFNVIYAQDIYDPFGKPGAGAPRYDRQNGRLKTRIAGTMQWNIDGRTDQTRQNRTPVKSQPNLLEFKRLPDYPIKVPLNSEATTYRQNFCGIDNTNDFNLISHRNLSPTRCFQDKTYLEKQAEIRSLNRDRQVKFNLNEENISYNPNAYTSLWFGRAGGGAPTNDARRRKLWESLENPNILKPKADYFVSPRY